MSTRHDVTVDSGGDALAVWHYPAAGEALTGTRGRPCVVMAHGFAATRDCGLDSFAEALSEAGCDVLLFDYRGFGASGGAERQLVSPAGQRADYHAVIAHARSLDGVDAERIVAWGVSFAGGHVVQVAAEDGRLAAVVSLTPGADGLATLLATVRRAGPVHAGKLTWLGLKDVARAFRGRPALLAPAIARPGESGALTAPGALEGMQRSAGPTWRNAVAARVFLEVGTYRPIRFAAKLACPLLVQIADDDQNVPVAAEVRLAALGRAEVRHYPGDHFDVYPRGPIHALVAEHQVAFLARHLAVDRVAAAT